MFDTTFEGKIGKPKFLRPSLVTSPEIVPGGVRPVDHVLDLAVHADRAAVVVQHREDERLPEVGGQAHVLRASNNAERLRESPVRFAQLFHEIKGAQPTLFKCGRGLELSNF